LNGRVFSLQKEHLGIIVYTDKINSKDNWGGKVKLTTLVVLPVVWTGAAMGLVANGGADQTMFTGWKLKDSGSGNQTNFLTGFTFGAGDFQIAPNSYGKTYCRSYAK
jgi:hypothetical protein